MGATLKKSVGASKLHSWRKSNGRTQKEIADYCGVYVVTVGNWERGQARPNVEAMLMLEKLTDRAVQVEDWTETQAA